MNYYSRLNSVRDTFNEKKLKKYALNDSNPKIREIAVSKIKNPIILSYIAKNDSNFNVIKRAIENIDDEHELKNLCIHLSKMADEYVDLCLEIMNKIKNWDYLIECAYEYGHRKRFSILTEINGITHIVRFIEDNGLIIGSPPDLMNKIHKISIPSKKDIININNQNLLERIALNQHNNNYYREFAIDCIASQDILKEIVISLTTYKAFKERSICLMAVDSITNQDILKEIVFTNEEMDICLRAVGGITNQDILKEIILNGEWQQKEQIIKSYHRNRSWNDDIRLKATKNVKNQNLIINLALNDSYWKIRYEATKHITNQELLLEIALKDTNEDVRNQAINNIMNIESLLEISTDTDKNNMIVSKESKETKILYEFLKSG